MRESILVRIAADPPGRLWNGVGDLPVPADAIESEDSPYLGGAQLIAVPDFQQLINGVAERLDVTVSGVSAEALRLALQDAASLKGAGLDIGLMRFDDAWQQLGAVSWVARFRIDTLTVNSQPSDQGRTRTITLSIGTENTGRSRAPIAFFTDADQRRRSPTDRFFDHVAGITAGTSRRFGPS